MTKIASLRMAKNSAISGSFHKICADNGSALLDRIEFGTFEYDHTGIPTGSHLTVSTEPFDITAGKCIDGAGIAFFHTADDGGTKPIVYYHKGYIEGPISQD